MASFLESFFAQIAAPMATVAAAGVTWICAWGARWFYMRAKNENVKAGILRLNDAVNTAVLEIQQTVVTTLKERSGDGKLTAADVAAVREAALATAAAQLGGPKGVESLKKVLGVDDMANVIASKIEASVQQVKASTVAPAPPSVSVTVK